MNAAFNAAISDVKKGHGNSADIHGHCTEIFHKTYYFVLLTTKISWQNSPRKFWHSFSRSTPPHKFRHQARKERDEKREETAKKWQKNEYKLKIKIKRTEAHGAKQVSEWVSVKKTWSRAWADIRAYCEERGGRGGRAGRAGDDGEELMAEELRWGLRGGLGGPRGDGAGVSWAVSLVQSSNSSSSSSSSSSSPNGFRLAS